MQVMIYITSYMLLTAILLQLIAFLARLSCLSFPKYVAIQLSNKKNL